ncbi:MAG: hypothetical protein A2808_03090 [Candidatus Moranbacteria bacterium RIFCSPHIGHO2_01_FULL_55_24]|nr:MAG: hypothetical protein A2808_03090 [Candidatus Moranbacteria bacterium RIFCSPHIGHO2_01_FULL_55_24]
MKPKDWYMRLFVAGLLVLIGWALYVSSKQLERNKRIAQEVNTLQEEAEKIRKENETLSERIGYFSSQEFREQEAKKKLGLKKPQETVVAIKEEVPEEQGQDAVSESPKEASKSPSEIYMKWWQLFFAKN